MDHEHADERRERDTPTDWEALHLVGEEAFTFDVFMAAYWRYIHLKVKKEQTRDLSGAEVLEMNLFQKNMHHFLHAIMHKIAQVNVTEMEVMRLLKRERDSSEHHDHSR